MHLRTREMHKEGFFNHTIKVEVDGKTIDVLPRDVQVDPDHLGAFTVANIGMVSIPEGKWTGAGLQVEGVVAQFLTKGLALGTVISAGAFGSVSIKVRGVRRLHLE